MPPYPTRPLRDHPTGSLRLPTFRHAGSSALAAFALVALLSGCASLPSIATRPAPAHVSAPPPAGSSDLDWPARTRDGRKAMRSRSFENAEKHFTAALEASSRMRASDVRVDVSFQNLVRVASIYERIGRHDDAVRVMRVVASAAAKRSDGPLRVATYGQRFEGLVSKPLPPRLLPPELARRDESPPFDRLILRTAESYDVDPALVKAVVAAESNFEPRAVSRVGAQGLMQLMPQTARAMGVRRPFAPSENIRGGVRYLRHLLDRFEDLPHALAAYNAGPDAVMRYGGIPPYPETEAYVTRVLGHYRRYQDSFFR